MTGTLLIILSWFLIFLFLVWKVKFFQPANITFRLAGPVFIAKCAGAILTGWLYTYYYSSGDTFVLFDNSAIFFDALKSNPADYFKMIFGIDSGSDYLKEMYFSKMNAWYNNEYDILFNDSRTIIRIHAVLRIFSFGQYYVHSLFFSFFSFAGLTAIYRTFLPYIKKHHELFYAGTFLFPSLVFWGSGALKEAVVILAIGFLCYSSYRFILKKTAWKFLTFLIAAYILILTRFYFLIALIPGLISFLLSVNGKNTWKKFAVVHLVWLLLLYCYGFINPSCDVPCIMSMKQNNFVQLAQFSKSGSIISNEFLQPTWKGLISESPSAFTTSLTQPLVFTSDQMLLRLASVETLFTLLMIIEALVLFRIPPKKDVPLLLFCLSFFVITFTFLGLTTPVAGTLVRYKVVALPFLVFVAGYFISNSKLFDKEESHIFKNKS